MSQEEIGAPGMDEWMEETAKGNTITTQELDELCVAYKAARDEYDEAKEKSTILYNESERIKGKVVEALELSGKQKYFVDGIGTFSFKDTMSVRVPDGIEAKKELWSYLAYKYGPTVVWDKFSINSRTLNSFYNSELEIFNEKAKNGEATGDFHLPGIQPPTAQRDLKFTKEKKK